MICCWQNVYWTLPLEHVKEGIAVLDWRKRMQVNAEIETPLQNNG